MTRVILALVMLAACETTPTVTNALDGGVACGTLECAANEVCVDQAAGVDAGAGGDNRYCFAVPDGCYVFNCRGERCAPCLQALCTAQPVQVNGRFVDCPGQ